MSGGNTQPDFWQLGQQIGGMARQLADLAVHIREMREESNERHEQNLAKMDEQRQKLSDFKHESANLQQGNDNRLELLRIDTKKLQDEVHELKKPVEELIRQRNTVLSIGAAGTAIAGVLWTFAEPIWGFFRERILGAWFGHH